MRIRRFSTRITRSSALDLPSIRCSYRISSSAYSGFTPMPSTAAAAAAVRDAEAQLWRHRVSKAY